MKTLIYPFEEEYAYFWEELPLYRKDLDVTSLVLTNPYIKSAIPKNITVYKSFKEASENVECIVFLPMDNVSFLHNKIIEVLKKRKKVICGVNFSLETLAFFKEVAQQYGGSFECHENASLVEFLKRRADIFTQQESVVIAVGALTQGMNTSEIVVKLNRELTTRGYRVGVIATKSELFVLNIKQLPLDEIIDPDLDYTIMQINRYTNLFQLVERPEIIILQLPDEGLYRVSSDYSTCFGAKTYLISQAIDIDYCIMVTPYMDMDKEVFSMLSDISKNRYGFEYNSIFFEDKVVDMQGAAGETTLRYYLSQSDDTKQTVQKLQSENSSERLFVNSDISLYNRIADDIIKQLS